MQPFPTTINAVNLARSFALHTLIKQLDQVNDIHEVYGQSELEISLLEELINEIISSITPLEE